MSAEEVKIANSKETALEVAHVNIYLEIHLLFNTNKYIVVFFTRIVITNNQSVSKRLL